MQKRYRALVEEHSASTSPIAAGLRALPGGSSAFAATQAAWRFYRNPRVTLPALMAPVLAHVREQAAQLGPSEYLLVAHDGSWLNFTGHRSKADRITPSTCKAPGYTLLSSLAISSRTGAPLGALAHELTCADGVHTTRSEHVAARSEHVAARSEHVAARSEHVAARSEEATQLQTQVRHAEGLALGRPLVHLLDRGADAVAMYRFFQQAGWLCLVRADAHQRVQHQGASRLLSELPARLQLTPSGEVLYRGQRAWQFLAETEVCLTRPASNGSHHRGRKAGASPVPGPPVRLRLLISDVRDAQGQLLARWYLYTNVPESVPASTIALWYYWRWKVEGFFKLLKSAGWNLEDWQQESALALAKRLAVVSMAAALLWAVQHSQEPPVQALAQELVRLSGRQMRRDRPVTGPALLAGLWVLLSTLEVLQQYDPEHLLQLGRRWRSLTSALGP